MAFTACLDRELQPTGVTTLCLVTPGIKTRMFDDIEVKYAKMIKRSIEHNEPLIVSFNAPQVDEKCSPCSCIIRDQYDETSSRTSILFRVA